MKKMALFVFNGDPMCFIHVLLNALDMNEKGYEAKIIVEGAATKLIRESVCFASIIISVADIRI